VIEATITLGYNDERMARAIYLAILPDNGPYVDSELGRDTIILHARAATAASLRHTLDDLLSCIRVAEEAIRIDGSPLGP
jgi:tRNA threonylcarbamoyladenosine modification (KEOPS) complex  Pcc1 subunit